MINKTLRCPRGRVFHASPASKPGAANYARVMRCALTSAALFCTSSYAVACSLALEISAKMSRNSAEVTNVDRIRLANLTINVRNLPMRSDAIIYGYAFAGSMTPPH